MAVKIVFIGNIFRGDDGIAPYIYKELKDHTDLKGYSLIEFGVMGLDLLSVISRDDHLILIDALRSENGLGDVVKVDVDELNAKFSSVSGHDFGVEQTTAILKAYNPRMKMDIFGIKVRNLNAFCPEISQEILDRKEDIKQELLEKIRCATLYLRK